MGCDIHLYVEHQDESGRWWFCEDGFKSDYYKEGHEYFGTEAYRDGPTPYCGRNYTLFAYLANVRNGYGFAGCDTGNAIVPIAEPKGIPSDVSLTIKEKSDRWSSDGHSHSFFTLGELKQAFENAKKIVKTYRGWVSAEEYKTFVKNGKPDCWSGGIDGGQIAKISNLEMAHRIKENDFAEGKNYYTQIEWKVSLGDDLKHFFEHVIPQLEKYDGGKEDDKIRIVFWFDN